MLFHLYFFILSVRMIIYLWWIRNYFDSTQERNGKISQALNRLIVTQYYSHYFIRPGCFSSTDDALSMMRERAKKRT